MDLKMDFETFWALYRPDEHFENRLGAAPALRTKRLVRGEAYNKENASYKPKP